MSNQAIVIGLGQFGTAVARALSERRVEVLAVDIVEERVRAISPFVAEAVCFDATDELALGRTAPDRRDLCVCALGDEAREASIICTALLRQMGAKRIVSRTNDPLHERILRLVGAHRVVNPEAEYGRRIVNRLLHDHIIGELALGDDLLISELTIPGSFVGRTLAQLELPRAYQVTVVAVRARKAGAVSLPDPNRKLEVGDVLVVVSNEASIAKLLERT
jgi:trk system potassium uptake protein TrkA